MNMRRVLLAIAIVAGVGSGIGSAQQPANRQPGNVPTAADPNAIKVYIRAGLKSLATGEKRLETPHLAVKYDVPKESLFWQK